MAKGGTGDLWFGANFALVRVRADGAVEIYERRQLGLAEGFGIYLTTDGEGRLWFGSFDRLCRVVAEPRPGGPPAVERCQKVLDGSAKDYINLVHPAGGGRAWLLSLRGVGHFGRAGAQRLLKLSGQAEPETLQD